jgi:hypothetical protein
LLRGGNIQIGLTLALTLAAGAVRADELVLPQPSWPLGDAELRVAGDAGGALFGPDQPGWRGAQVSGALRLMPQIRRDYDSGLSLGLVSTFTLADPLSRGRYDGDVIEKLAGEVRTGLGTVAMGITDGAGYALAATGPKADADVALEDARTTFFRDPVTHRAVNRIFALRTEVGASSNYAKFVYTSPLLFGAQIAVSFTPSEGKQLPFLNAGPHVPGRQADFWEAALKYEDELGPVSLAAYAAVLESRSEHKLPGQEGSSDLGAGLRADYPVTDEIAVSLGGSYRQSNAYGFDINQSFQAGTTRAGHVSGGVSYGSWNATVEYGAGTADAVAALPRLGLTGWETAVSYRVSPSVLVSGGWQKLDYSRSSGVFFNGSPQLKMDAVFVHLKLQTSEQ